MKLNTMKLPAICTGALLALCSCMTVQAAYPTGEWTFKEIHGISDTLVSGMMQAQLEGQKIYTEDDQMAILIADTRSVVQLTLLSEDAKDAPADIGTCDKYLMGAGKDAGNCWISDTALLIPVPMDEDTKAVLGGDCIYEFELAADNLDAAPADVFDASSADTGNAAAEPSKEEAAAASAETTPDAEEEKDPSAPLHFELDGGILDYNSYEYANAGMFIYSDDDPDKTIILNFDYTNKEKTPKSYMQDFWIRAYQNGKELSWSGSYDPDAAPESFKNKSAQVLENGTITIGVMFTLEDMSPLTIIANHNGGMEVSDPMELPLEAREDNSFNINRIYGRWQDQDSGAEVTITSSEIRWKKGGSGSSMPEPKMWTEEHTLHQPLNKIGKTLEIVEEEGQPLRLVNSEVNLVQIENWPEEELPEGDVVLAEKQYKYYEECPALPTLSSVLDVKEAGSNKIKVNGVVTEIHYNYSGDEDVAAAYAAALTEMGFTISEEGGARVIYADTFKVGDISIKNGEVSVGIKPDAYELTELAGGTKLGETTDVSLGEPIETEKETFTLEKVEMLPEIFPSDTSGLYFSYKADPGMLYLNAEGDLYNAGKEMLHIRDLFKMTVTYADGYTYDGFVAVDKGTTNFYEMNGDEVCAPLASCRYHFLASVPEEVASSSEPLYLTFKLSDGRTYRYDVRGGASSGDAADTVYTDTETVKKVQEALNAAGYDCGTPDGISGAKTEAAIAAYRAAQSLPEAAGITGDLLASLGI